MTVPPVPLYQPLNTLKPVADNIWIVDGGIVCMDAPFTKIPFSTRMTVVRLSDGGLWCHSPIAPDEQLLRQIDALGKVHHLVSPNCLHYAHILAWKKRYPQATAWAAPNVRKRAAKQKVAVCFDKDLADTAPKDWAADIAQHIFSGSRIIKETVFFHHASKTLILTDLIENFETEYIGRFWRFIIRLAGIAHPDGKTPRDMQATFTDRAAARASLAAIKAWQPEKIILAHGRCYLEHGAAELERAFRWLD